MAFFYIAKKDQTIMSRTDDRDGKMGRKKIPVPVFKLICRVEALACGYLWKENGLFSFRHFSTNKILPLT